MPSIFHDRLFSLRWFKNMFLIIIGTFIMSSGFVFFIDPHGIVPGGVFGIGVVINKLTEGMLPNGPFDIDQNTSFISTIQYYINNLFIKYNGGIPIGLFSLVVNIPLTILGIKLLGSRFGFKTITGVILLTIFIDSLTSWWGLVPLVEDKLLSSIFGGILIGFGLGVVFKARATTAGTDILATIITRFSRIPLGQTIIIVDSIIVLSSLFAKPDWQIPLYSWITIYISGRVINLVITGIQYEKALFIISDKHLEIRSKIMTDLERSGTYIKSEGFFSETANNMIFVVLKRREVFILQNYIYSIDLNAFVAIMNTSEILGEGFKSLKQKVKEVI